MTQVSKILSIASTEVGYRAARSPGERPSGHQKYSPAVPGLEWSQYQPWCATWVSWVAMQAGVANLFPRTASVWTAMNWFKNSGRWSAYPAIGAQVIYGTSGSTHTGLCTGYDSTWIYTIEGNTSLSNDANGNGVMRRQRRRRDTYVHGYGLPEFTEGIVTADPALRGKPGFIYQAAASGPATGPDRTTPSPRRYRITKGQTLTGVAAILGVSLAAILAANPEIKDPDRVDEGQEINVPAKPEPPTSPVKPSTSPKKPKPPEKPKPPAAPISGTTYTVSKGDSLSSIAARASITLAQLLTWNPGLANAPHLIYPGQEVKVRPGKHAARAAVPTAQKTVAHRQHVRSATRQPTNPVRPAHGDDRLARIERELRAVKGQLDEVSNKLDKLASKPVEKSRKCVDRESAHRRQSHVRPAHEQRPEPTADMTAPTPPAGGRVPDMHA
ncbi:LysM peptidoglycan-binding domain-containing protein [Streptomyces noursei]|uniref:LysM peptidoglycan-binding domain-containing protein n=1 Tax=Streptomyces noursei TaxID=1971 RepID=UPI00167899AB|nr:LysM peptidoglycan-binding domain-containing protein [Streptomyces noursei]MCZ1015623.1 LysM peptidoglycan-binding domain-containing protein [Streptomyces noursei]GGW89534.1 hypothetical protein GCM10010341_07960 [Streptomyces noursei]